MFKTRKSKQFNYKPIFYDKDKVQREKDKAKRNISFRKEDSNFKKINFDNWERKSYSDMRNEGKKRMKFLIIITSFLLFIVWFFFAYAAGEIEILDFLKNE
jgi:hypothetical protein